MLKFNKSKWLTLFSLVTITTSAFIPILSVPNVVFADENETTTTDNDKDKDDAGIGGITNPAIKEKYIDRTAYNFGTQFEVTYQYLNGTFLSNKDYASLYSGGKVGGTTTRNDISQYIKNPKNIGQSIEISEKDYKADTALIEKDEVSEEAKEDLAPAKIDAIAKKLADELTAKALDTYATSYKFVPVSGVFFGKSTYKATTFKITTFSRDAVDGSEKTAIKNAVNKAIISYVKNKLSSPSYIAGSTKASEYEKAIKKELTEILFYGTFGRNMFATQSGSVKIERPTSEQSSEFVNYATYYMSENAPKRPKGLANVNGTISIEGTGKQLQQNGKATKDTLDGDEDIKEKTRFLDGLFALTHIPKASNKKKGDAFNASVQTALKKASSDITALSKALEKSTDGIVGDGTLLAFSPLNLSVDTTVKSFDKEAYNKHIKDSGILEDSESDIVQVLDLNNNPRAIQLRDLIIYNQAGATTSKILSGTTSKNRGYPVLSTGGSSSLDSKTSLRQYLGIYYPSSKRKLLVSGDFGLNYTTLMSDSNPNASTALYKAITSSQLYKDKVVGSLGAKDSIVALGLDNYGNIIVTETGDVVIPYWQNELFLSGMYKHKIVANTAFKDYSSIPALSNLISQQTNWYDLDALQKKALDKVSSSSYFTDKTAVTNQIKNFLKNSGASGSDLTTKYINASSNQSIKAEDNAVLAMMIALVTADEIKTFNKNFNTSLKDGAGFYTFPSSTNYLSQEDYDDLKLSRWTASSLIQKIGMFFDYGIFEILRLTTAQMSVSLYDSLISWAGNMFHTSNVTETKTWDSILFALSNFAFAFMLIYLSYVSYAVFSNRVRVKDVVIKTLMVVVILFIPYTGYNLITNAIINQPSQYVLNDVVKQSMVVSFLEDRQENTGTVSDEMALAYEELFGSQQGNKEQTTKSYMLTFYTTTNRDGVDISNLKNTASAENGWFKSNSKTINTLTNQYNKRNLVSVQASMFDLYVWSTEQVFVRDGVPTHLESIYGDKEYKNQTFFEYLENKYESEGTYEGLSSYKEYQIDMSTLYSSDVTKNGILKDNVNTTSVGKVTASELFYRMQKNSLASYSSTNPETAMNKGLNSIVNMLSLFNIDYKYTEGEDGYYIPTSDDYDMFIRDMSMTSYTRTNAYGSTKNLNFSDFTLSVLGKNKKYKLPDEAIQKNYVPKEDYFGVYTTIKDMMVAQNNISNPNYTNAYKATFNVVSDTLNTVARKYANIEQVFNVNTDNRDVNSAIQMTVLMELYFNLTQELGLKNFPQDYVPTSVSFDSLLKQVYIPISDYNFQTYRTSDLVVTNLMEYLTLTENPFFILVVFIAILLVFAMWLVYLFVFQFVMLLVILYKFTKEYVLHSNYGNKSWKGAIYIYLIMGMARLGLSVIWWIAYSLLNSSFASYGGLTYNVAFVHSIAIILYIVFVFKKVFIPLLKSVIDDKENLGGESISRGIEKIKGDISMKSGALKLARSPLNFAKSAGRNLKRTKNIAQGTGGAIGKLATKAGGATMKVSRAIGDTEAVRSMNSKIQKQSESSLRNRGAVGNFVANKVFKSEFDAISNENDLLQASRGTSLKSSYVDFRMLKNDIKAEKIAKKMQSPLSFGDVMNATSTATKLGTTMLELNNLPQEILATKGLELVEYLSKTMGVASKIVTSRNENGEIVKSLALDASSYDLDSSEGRETAVLGIQNFALKSLLETDRVFNSGDLSKNEAFMSSSRVNQPLYTVGKSGEILMDTTLKNGVDYNTLAKVFTDKTLNVSEFSEEQEELLEKFSFEKVMVKDAKGNAIENLSKYRLVPKKKMSQKELDKQISNLVNIDSSVRRRFNKPEADYSNPDRLAYEQVNFTTQEQEDILENLVEKTHGVSFIDGNTIVYDPTNVRARDAVKNYMKSFKTNNTAQATQLRKLDRNLSAYASKGEGNGLIEPKVYNGTENASRIDSVFGKGYASNKAYTVALDKDNDFRSDSLVSTLNLASATAKLVHNKEFREEVENKEQGRRLLKKSLRTVLKKETGNIGDALEYIEKNDSLLSSSELFKTVQHDYQSLQTQYENRNISEEKYNSIMPFIANQATEMLENASLLEGFSSKVDFDKAGVGIKNSQIKKTIGDIVSSKESIRKSLMLSDIEDVDKHNIDADFIERASSIFGESGEVIVNPINSTLEVRSSKDLTKGTGNILQSFQQSEYNNMLNTTFNNDSPLIQKYAEKLTSEKETPADLKRIMEKENVVVPTKTSLDDMLKTKKGKSKKKTHVAKQMPKIQTVFDTNVKQSEETFLELRNKIGAKYNEGKALTLEDQDKFKNIYGEIARIKSEESAIGDKINDAKHIELNYRMNKVSEDLKELENKVNNM